MYLQVLFTTATKYMCLYYLLIINNSCVEDLMSPEVRAHTVRYTSLEAFFVCLISPLSVCDVNLVLSVRQCRTCKSSPPVAWGGPLSTCPCTCTLQRCQSVTQQTKASSHCSAQFTHIPPPPTAPYWTWLAGNKRGLQPVDINIMSRGVFRAHEDVAPVPSENLQNGISEYVE